MYYIVNQRDHIIAADSSFLALFGLSTIEDLHKDIALGSVEIATLGSQELNLTVSGETQNYTTTQKSLSTLLGDMTLIVVNQTHEDVPKMEVETPVSIIDDEPITFDLGSDDEVTVEEEEEEISFLKEGPAIPAVEEEKPFTLIEDEETPVMEVSKPEDTEEKETSVETDTDDSPIYIDIQNISQKIGISEEDYTHFLNEYIDTALTLEGDLKSTQEKKRTHAINTLSHLSNVLHLPIISTIVEEIKNNIEDDDNTHITSLYATLTRLTTSTPKELDEPEETTISTQRAPVIGAESFGTIDLSNVKPIHFDFQLEEAANDLSLPVELIEEFVVDFIEQAHVETKKMLEAYELGDLPTIQKIGHLLKGTSSNLRINALSDTLYEIQFCEDSSKLEKLIKEYWGHFLSFEHQINIKLK